MKKTVFFALGVISILLFNSCCKQCRFDNNKISFRGYTDAEMERIRIIYYEPGGDFSVAEDTLTINAYPDGNVHTIRPTVAISEEHDYKIDILSTSETFEVTAVSIVSKKCDCDDSDFMESHKLDGEAKEGTILIQK